MTKQEQERARIVTFLWSVWGSATHGSSNLMERAILAVESNQMSDPWKVARPGASEAELHAAAEEYNRQETNEQETAPEAAAFVAEVAGATPASGSTKPQT